MTLFPELARTMKDQPKPGSAELRGNGTQAVDEELAGELGWTLLKEGYLFIQSLIKTQNFGYNAQAYTKD